jgi:pilus assembly protein CpaB
MARSIAGAAPGRTNRRFLIIALLFAVLSGTLIYAWMASQSGDGGGDSVATGSTSVVVAKAPIRQRTEITPEMVELKSIPTSALVTGGFTTVEDVVGKVTKLPLEANEQVTTTSVVDTDRPTAEALSLVVPNGRRGFSVVATEVKNAGGLILPGDYVDVVWVCCEKGLEWGGRSTDGTETSTDAIILSRTIVQNVQVAAVAQQIVSSGPVASGDGTGLDDDPVASETGDQKPEAISTTLLVTPEQAQILLMAESTGEMRLALRGIGDANIVPPTEDYEYITPGLIPFEIMEALRQAFGPGTQ